MRREKREKLAKKRQDAQEQGPGPAVDIPASNPQELQEKLVEIEERLEAVEDGLNINIEV